MKLSDIEKTQLKLLYHNGYRYLARDSIGLCAYIKRPYRLRSLFVKNEMSDWLFSISDYQHIFLILDPDEFQKIGYKDLHPYKITASGNLIFDKPKQKVVAV